MRRAGDFLLLLAIVTLAVRPAGAQRGTPGPEVILGTDPAGFSKWLEAARPAPLSVETKARILASLPAEGEITDLDARARRKVAAVAELLGAAGRSSAYDVKIVDVPQALIGLHARAVVLITKPALDLLDAGDLQALAAHEIGHEYVWHQYEEAKRLQEHDRVKQLELRCDGIGMMMLRDAGADPLRLVKAVERIIRFNRERFGTARNEHEYPTLAERWAFARAVVVWADGGNRR